MDGYSLAKLRGEVGMRGRGLLQWMIAVAIVAVLIFLIDFGKLPQVARTLHLLPLLESLSLILFSQFLSSVRFHALIKDNGIIVPRAEAYRANIYSIVGGLFLFNVFGQGLTRTALLKKYGVPASTVFLLTLLERIVALGVLLIAAIFGTAVLFKQLNFSLEDNTLLLLRSICAGSIAFGFIYFAGLSRRQRVVFLWLVRQLFSLAMLRLVSITVLMHAAMVAAYVVLAIDLAPATPVVLAASASIIVMLVSSLPISFSGWGLRELSASVAFARIGLSLEQGLLIGIAIGCLSLLALAGNAAWIGVRRIGASSIEPDEMISADSLQIERVAYWIIGLFVAFACLLNVGVPTASGRINVNPGDPIAIIGALALLGLAWQRGVFIGLWQTKWIPLGLLALSLALSISLLNGYLKYGPIDWAIYNRFLGWFVLLSYFATGTLVVVSIGTIGLTSLCRVLAASAAGIVAFELFARVTPQLTDFFLRDVSQIFRAEGLANNPNAFAFQLLMAMAALMALDFKDNSRGSWRTTLLAGLLLAGFWLSGSRAGVLALLFSIGAFIVMNLRAPRLNFIVVRLGVALLSAIVVTLLPTFIQLSWNAVVTMAPITEHFDLGPIKAAVGVGPTSGLSSINTFSLAADRIASLNEGLELWKMHPLFGGGLGAFIQERTMKTGVPLVIHNSFLWIAAELGMAGLAAFGLFIFALAMIAFSKHVSYKARVLLVAAMVAFVVMSAGHDVFYQRLLWLLIGAAAAVPHALMKSARRG